MIQTEVSTAFSSRCIGILGDGQLALMLGEAAEKMGIEFFAFGEDANSPFAAKFPKRFVQGHVPSGITDSTLQASKNALVDFANQIRLGNGVLTLENEFFTADQLHTLVKETGISIIPDQSSYRNFQDKISQRNFYQSLNIEGPHWSALEFLKLGSAPKAPFEFPFVVKTAVGGYDGYGVRIVHNDEEFRAALQQFKYQDGAAILAEEKVEIVREFAQGVLLDGKGGAVFLPLVETVQRNGTCVLTLSKLTLSAAENMMIAEKVKTALLKLTKSTLHGLFNFEFFYNARAQVWINEGAPRPHNSQHLTIDASPVSQFELLMGYLSAGSLKGTEFVCTLKNDVEGEAPQITAENAVMVNLLGRSTGPNYELKLPALPPEVQVFPKLYLKKECRPGRKMGHLNLVDPSGKLNLSELGEKILKEYEL